MSTFFDTNVLLYAEDGRYPDRRSLAQQLLRAALTEGTGVLSTQILQEFYVNAVRKLEMSKEHAQARTRAYQAFVVVPISPALIQIAIDLHRLDSISFWDALVVTTAEAGACSRLYSEDLQHGRTIRGVQVVNPFL